MTRGSRVTETIEGLARRRAAAGFFALSLGLLSGCSGCEATIREPIVAPLGVARRVGMAGEPAFAGGAGLQKIKLGTATRSAWKVAPTSSFEVDIAPDHTRLVFSIGKRDADPLAAQAAAQGEAAAATEGPPIGFYVDARIGETWKPVFSEVVRGAQSEWLDRTVELGRAAPGATALRFRTATAEGAQVVDEEAFWGSILLLRPQPSTTNPQDAAAVDAQPPNVILISLDTVSADRLSFYGNPEPLTPNLDRFLEKSAVFERAYATYGNTLVSHASLFTGLYPRNHGVYEESPQLEDNTWASTFASKGYVTVAITEDAFVGSNFGFDRGFDWFDDGPGESSTDIVPNGEKTFDAAKKWLDEHGKDTRFFLFIHTYEAHTPYRIRDDATRKLVERLNPGYQGRFSEGLQNDFPIMRHNAGREELPQADRDQLEALYQGGINFLDRLFGDFVSYFEKHPAARRTIIVVTSDHGEEFGAHGTLGHGHSLYNDVLHVPLAFHGPGVAQLVRFDAPVQLPDVLPTVLDLTGIPSDARFDGRSLAEAVSGRSAEIPTRPVYAEMVDTPFIVAQDKLEEECVRRGLKPDCRRRALMVQDGTLKLIWRISDARYELFDIEKDPEELRDIGSEKPEELARLKGLIEEYARGLRQTHVGPKVAPAAIDDATRRRLEALGYIQ